MGRLCCGKDVSTDEHVSKVQLMPWVTPYIHCTDNVASMLYVVWYMICSMYI